MLPPYVYDLIAAVQKWEDEHGDTSMCFSHVLDCVPTQERDRAAAIAHYQQERDRMERMPEDDAMPVGRLVTVGADDAFCPDCGSEGRPLYQSPRGLMVCRKCSSKAAS